MSTSSTRDHPVATGNQTPPAPSHVIVVSGLCRFCVEAPTCTHLQDANRPVLRCAEAVLQEVGVPSPFGHTSEPAPVPSAHPQARGLCSNCDNREDCTFRMRNPEGGIWRCEEYA